MINLGDTIVVEVGAWGSWFNMTFSTFRFNLIVLVEGGRQLRLSGGFKLIWSTFFFYFFFWVYKEGIKGPGQRRR